MDASSATALDADSKLEIEGLLKMQFAEPLPTVLKRAQKNSKTMHINEALNTVGHRMTSDIRGLLVSPNTTREVSLRASSFASVGTAPAGGLGKQSTFDKAMAFINHEYKIVREELDLKLLECGFFKLLKEGLLFETQDKLDELAMDMGLAEATMNACQAEIRKQNDIIDDLSAELYKVTTQCKIIHDELAAIKAMAEEDLRVINLILSVAKEECEKMAKEWAAASAAANGFIQVHACLGPDGTTHFEANNFLQEQGSKFKQTSSQQAFQRVLFELYGFDSPLPGKLNLQALDDFDDDTDDFPPELTQAETANSDSFVQVDSSVAPPAAGTSNKASNDEQRERCSSIARKPRCEKLLDKLGQMQGEIITALNIATDNLMRHDRECEIEIAQLNSEIQTCRDIIATQTEQFDRTSAFHNGMYIEHGHQAALKHELCKELRAKFKECYQKLKELEGEMCGLLKIRQAVYNKIKNPDGKKPQLLIQDCMMSDWVVGECSGTCRFPDGGVGIQLITRQPVEEWSNKTEEGKYGASCPPDEVSRDCAEEMCPIDCVMKDWSGWSECTAQCGGGSESRSRGVLTPDEYGGKKCPGNSESDACNTQSCDTDCVLSDWTAWGPCTKSCRAKASWRPGMQTRTKSIVTPTIGAGQCWKERTPERWEKQFCNTNPCPKTIECVANLDVVFVLDGSGSIRYRKRGRKHWARNFIMMQDFIAKIVAQSKVAKLNEFEQIGDGLRFGVVLYSFRATRVSAVTNDKDALLANIKKMRWPRGGTMTGRGLTLAQKLLETATGGGSTRLKVIVLLTDGRASNKKWAMKAAIQVKAAGN